MWPVNLTKENSSNSLEINAWREYEWLGADPANKRLGRFLSLIQYSQCHDMNFTAQPPSDMLFSLSLPIANGNNSKWACIKLSYPVINSISVTYLNGTKPSSILGTATDAVTTKA